MTYKNSTEVKNLKSRHLTCSSDSDSQHNVSQSPTTSEFCRLPAKRKRKSRTANFGSLHLVSKTPVKQVSGTLVDDCIDPILAGHPPEILVTPDFSEENLERMRPDVLFK